MIFRTSLVVLALVVAPLAANADLDVRIEQSEAMFSGQCGGIISLGLVAPAPIPGVLWTRHRGTKQRKCLGRLDSSAFVVQCRRSFLCSLRQRELRGFGDAVDGVVSNPNGWGVGPDEDAATNDDDVYIFNTLGAAIPSSGMFTLTVPGANIDKYNVGVFTNNPNATVTVVGVPEPSAFAFLGLIGVVASGWQWKKRR